MITAIDTNVLLDILAPDPEFFERSAPALEEAASSGSLVICDLVYAELCVHFQDQSDCDHFLEQNDILVQALSRDACFLASRLWRTYRQGAAREAAFSATSWWALTRRSKRRNSSPVIAAFIERFSAPSLWLIPHAHAAPDH